MHFPSAIGSLKMQRNLSALPESGPTGSFKTLAVSSPKPFVFHVELHRPSKFNAISKQMWLWVIQ